MNSAKPQLVVQLGSLLVKPGWTRPGLPPFRLAGLTKNWIFFPTENQTRPPMM